MLAFDTLFSCQGAQYPTRAQQCGYGPPILRRAERREEGPAAETAGAVRYCCRGPCRKQVSPTVSSAVF